MVAPHFSHCLKYEFSSSDVCGYYGHVGQAFVVVAKRNGLPCQHTEYKVREHRTVQYSTTQYNTMQDTHLRFLYLLVTASFLLMFKHFCTLSFVPCFLCLFF